jgi:hypothetical protein
MNESRNYAYCEQVQHDLELLVEAAIKQNFHEVGVRKQLLVNFLMRLISARIDGRSPLGEHRIIHRIPLP